jgi:hypothetical protein
MLPAGSSSRNQGTAGHWCPESEMRSIIPASAILVIHDKSSLDFVSGSLTRDTSARAITTGLYPILVTSRAGFIDEDRPSPGSQCGLWVLAFG